MERVINFFKSMLGDGNDISSKRVITFLAFLLCAVAFVCNIFLDIPLKEYVWNGMLYLVGAGLGFTTLEQFAKK